MFESGLTFGLTNFEHRVSPLESAREKINHHLTMNDLFLIRVSEIFPRIAQVNRAFGRAAARADDRLLVELERLYWFSMEFGLVLEEGEARAFGAGLLSSVDELAGACASGSLEPFRAELVTAVDFETQSMNPRHFVAPSYEELLGETEEWLERRT